MMNFIIVPIITAIFLMGLGVASSKSDAMVTWNARVSSCSAAGGTIVPKTTLCISNSVIIPYAGDKKP